MPGGAHYQSSNGSITHAPSLVDTYYTAQRNMDGPFVMTSVYGRLSFSSLASEKPSQKHPHMVSANMKWCSVGDYSSPDDVPVSLMKLLDKLVLCSIVRVVYHVRL